MSISTLAILLPKTSLEDIIGAIYDKYGETELEELGKDKWYLHFEADDDYRTLYISFDNSCKEDYNIEGVYCNISYWGNAIEIQKYLCECFGGYFKENDWNKDFEYIGKK